MFLPLPLFLQQLLTDLIVFTSHFLKLLGDSGGCGARRQKESKRGHTICCDCKVGAMKKKSLTVRTLMQNVFVSAELNGNNAETMQIVPSLSVSECSVFVVTAADSVEWTNVGVAAN